MACGLHKLVFSGASESSASMVPPPRDNSDFEDRVNLFWDVYSIDRFCMLFASVPIGLPHDDVIIKTPASRNQSAHCYHSQEITTCWPLSWESYDRVILFADPIRLGRANIKISTISFLLALCPTCSGQ
jgi:hypothetical protein